MTERRKLKKELGKLKHFRNELPRLIDCCNIYGDDFYNIETLERVKDEIKTLEEKIAAIDSQTHNL